MIKEKLETLKELLKIKKMPILIENLPNELLEESIILCHDCDISELNGHYEGIDFVAPQWYNYLLEMCSKKHTLLVLNQINLLPVTEQLKFLEIIKYHKISTFNLPDNCSVIITCSSLENKPLSEEIYSLVAHIG